MASFVPPLLDPENPDAIANWAREVADVLNGQVSIGEPVATLPDGTGGIDTTRPNGVKGHLSGSFVLVEVGTGDLGHAGAITCTHNLNIPTNIASLPAGALNVGWVVVRVEHSGNGVVAGDETISVNYRTGDAVTTTAIDLRFYASGARTVSDVHPIYVTLWFFPTTR